MKVDFSSGLNIYRKNAGVSAAANTGDNVAETGKKDVAEFSHGSTAGVDKNMLTLKSQLHRNISYPADAKRIEELHAMIKNGAYRISTDAIVNEILGE